MIAAYLYGEGVVSIDRIAEFLKSLSGDSLHLSGGTVYRFCSSFAGKCSELRGSLEEKLLSSHEICTDAAPVTNNGKMNYIRNFSTEEAVVYYPSGKREEGSGYLIRISGI